MRIFFNWIVVVVIATVLLISCASSQQLEDAPPQLVETCQPRGDAHLRLISWNLHDAPYSRPFEKRVAAIAQIIDCWEPDFLLLQEVFHNKNLDLLLAKLDFNYESLDSSELNRSWFRWPIAGDRRSGLSIVRHRNSDWLPVNGSYKYIEFDAQPSPCLIWQGDWFADKGFVYIDVGLRETEFRLYNTHLQSYYPEDPQYKIRQLQARQLHDDIMSAGRDLILLAGDLNVRAHCLLGQGACDDRAIYGEFVKGLIDETLTYRQTPSRFTHIEKDGSREWVDYFLVTPDFRGKFRTSFHLIKNQAPDVPYSDHNGLVIDIWLETE